MSENAPTPDLNAVWRWVTDQVKGQITMPGLWRAMEAAIPIALEDDQLVLGFPAREAHQAGLLTSNQYLNLIESVLERGAKRRLRLHVISGETVEEWEATKRMHQEAAKLQSQHKEQYARQAGAGGSWDAVSEQLVRKFSGLTNRSYACAQGLFLEDAITLIAESYPRLMPANPGDQDERNYSRCLDRVGERIGVPGSLLAYLVKQRL